MSRWFAFKKDSLESEKNVTYMQQDREVVVILI
jgi:hypothetical protein